MARSQVVTVTTVAQDVTIDGAWDFLEVVALGTITDGTITVRLDGTAVSEADDCDVLPAVAGAVLQIEHVPSYSSISLIASASVKVAVRGANRL